MSHVLDLIPTAVYQPEVPANALLTAADPAMLFGRRDSTTGGLTFGYYGGIMIVNGVPTVINDGTIALTDATTNYLEVDKSGGIHVNTTGWTPGYIPLWTLPTSGGAITTASCVSYRTWLKPHGLLTKSLSADANYTLTANEARVETLVLTSSVSLTTTRNIVLPLAAQTWIVVNSTTGAQSLQFIGATGTGVTVANGKTAIIRADGTNIARVTADV